MLKRTITTMSLLAVMISITAQDCSELNGTWQNELGSQLVIDSIESESGVIHGLYKSSSGVDGRTFPLLGWVNDLPDEADKHCVKTVAFSVHWGEFGSITSWTGYCVSDSTGHYIKTIWNLVRPNTNLPFEHIMTNSSTFRPD